MTAEMIDRDKAVEELRLAYTHLIDASQAVQVMDAQIGRVNHPVGFVIGGIADATYAVADMLEGE